MSRRSNILLAVLCVGGLLYPLSLLFSDTIIDSVYSDPVLDGYIKFSQNAQDYSVNNWMYSMSAGDSHGPIPFPDPNSYFRSYISYYLPDIPIGFHIDSVYVRLYQYQSGGYDASTGTYTDFPVWDVAGGDTIKCIMSHIDYGNELDVGDWEKGDLGNPYTYKNNIGTITESGEEGYRYIDVTDCILSDYQQERTLTQYRISFQIYTDWDDHPDNVAFTTSEYYDIGKPQLKLYLSEIVSLEDNEIGFDHSQIHVYPNPITEKGKISFSLNQSEHLQFDIYNIKGQLVGTVWSGNIERGENEILFDTKKLSNGIYFLKAKTNNCVLTKKIIIIK